MKTPDEIKTGVEFCTTKVISGNLKTCDLDCPYRVEGVWCRNALAHDTLEYIERLEDRNAWHEGNEKYLQSFLKDMSKQIEQLEAKAPKWISVEDEQKPQHHKEVLCRYIFDGDSECFYAVLTYYAYGDNGYVTGSHFTGEGLHDMRVTHWMPLPEPPTEV